MDGEGWGPKRHTTHLWKWQTPRKRKLWNSVPLIVALQGKPDYFPAVYLFIEKLPRILAILFAIFKMLSLNCPIKMDVFFRDAYPCGTSVHRVCSSACAGARVRGPGAFYPPPGGTIFDHIFTTCDSFLTTFGRILSNWDHFKRVLKHFDQFWAI